MIVSTFNLSKILSGVVGEMETITILTCMIPEIHVCCLVRLQSPLLFLGYGVELRPEKCFCRTL